jgi:hypothetical protein
MVQRLGYPDEKDNPDPRGDLDRWLEIGSWPTPAMRRTSYDDEQREPGAPDWWHGDEEASQTFFKSMGIDPAKLGGGT